MAEGQVCVYHQDCKVMLKDHDDRIREVEKDLEVGLHSIDTLCTTISGLTEKIERLIVTQTERVNDIEQNCAMASVTRQSLSDEISDLKDQLKWWNRALIGAGASLGFFIFKYLFENVLPLLQAAKGAN